MSNGLRLLEFYRVFFLCEYGKVTSVGLVLEMSAQIWDLNLNIPNFSYLICKITLVYIDYMRTECSWALEMVTSVNSQR